MCIILFCIGRRMDKKAKKAAISQTILYNNFIRQRARPGTTFAAGAFYYLVGVLTLHFGDPLQFLFTTPFISFPEIHLHSLARMIGAGRITINCLKYFWHIFDGVLFTWTTVFPSRLVSVQTLKLNRKCCNGAGRSVVILLMLRSYLVVYLRQC